MVTAILSDLNVGVSVVFIAADFQREYFNLNIWASGAIKRLIFSPPLVHHHLHCHCCYCVTSLRDDDEASKMTKMIDDDDNDDDVHLCVGEAANLPLLFFLPHLAHRLAPVDCDHC